MPMGGTLTVRTAQQNGMVRVEICDTGSGLEDGQAADAAVRYPAKLEGAGLGLATIQTVVSDHGGRMSVEAMPAAGTAFRMEFPIAPAPSPVKAPQAVNRSKASKPQPEAIPVKPQDPAPLKSQEATNKPKPVLARMMDI
jgi:hypothetical protein